MVLLNKLRKLRAEITDLVTQMDKGIAVLCLIIGGNVVRIALIGLG